MSCIFKMPIHRVKIVMIIIQSRPESILILQSRLDSLERSFTRSNGRILPDQCGTLSHIARQLDVADTPNMGNSHRPVIYDP